MADPFGKMRIPPGYSFTFKASGSGEYGAEAMYRHPSGRIETFDKTELAQGKSRTLSSRGIYSGHVLLTLGTGASVKIEMAVVKSTADGGGPFGETYSVTVPPAPGPTDLTPFMLMMLQE